MCKNNTMYVCGHTNAQPALAEEMEHEFQRAKEIESYINSHNCFSNDDDLWAIVRFMSVASCYSQHKHTRGKQAKFPPTRSKRWGTYEHIFVAEVFFDDGLNSGSSGEIELPLDVTDEEAMECILYSINYYEMNNHFPPYDIVLELFPYSNKCPVWHKPYFVQRQQDWINK